MIFIKSILTALCFLLTASLSFSQPIADSLKIGMQAPEIRLPNPNGDTVSLSSLRGKIVLVDFWASWCAPCLQEQPELKTIYEKYQHTVFENADGFIIFGVSLDSKKADWINAIKKNKMQWKQVSDLKFWNAAAAKLYNIEGIPANFLIDGNSIIIAKDVHGKNLINELKKLEKK